MLDNALFSVVKSQIMAKSKTDLSEFEATLIRKISASVYAKFGNLTAFGKNIGYEKYQIHEMLSGRHHLKIDQIKRLLDGIEESISTFFATEPMLPASAIPSLFPHNHLGGFAPNQSDGTVPKTCPTIPKICPISG